MADFDCNYFELVVMWPDLGLYNMKVQALGWSGFKSWTEFTFEMIGNQNQHKCETIIFLETIYSYIDTLIIYNFQNDQNYMVFRISKKLIMTECKIWLPVILKVKSVQYLNPCSWRPEPYKTIQDPVTWFQIIAVKVSHFRQLKMSKLRNLDGNSPLLDWNQIT